VETERKTLGRADCSIAYELRGAGPGQTVVLLHGFGMTRKSLRPLAAILHACGAAARSVLPDARGHGETRAPERDDAYGYPEMAGDLILLLEREAPSGAHLVGHSMGGQIALMAAISRPELVRSLALVAAGPCRAVGDERERRRWQRAAAAFEGASRAQLCAALASAAPTEDPKLEPERLYGDADGASLARVVRGGFLHVERNDHLCGQLAAPALVIAGGRDQTWIEPSRQLARLLPKSELRIVEDAGHLVHLEHLDEAAGWIADFVRAHAGGA
jgi:pimeloyl-ACP methyl ester carboxylesterase